MGSGLYLNRDRMVKDVLQAAKLGNIHLGKAQPAEEPALHPSHTSARGEKKNPSPKFPPKTPPAWGVHDGNRTSNPPPIIHFILSTAG